MFKSTECCVCSFKLPCYKCSTCHSAKYCSVACYQVHQSNQCPGTAGKLPQVARPVSRAKITDVVPTSKMQALENCQPLRELLRLKPGLQDLLVFIDRHPKQWVALEMAMKNADFQQFASVCLRTVFPEIYAGLSVTQESSGLISLLQAMCNVDSD